MHLSGLFRWSISSQETLIIKCWNVIVGYFPNVFPKLHPLPQLCTLYSYFCRSAYETAVEEAGSFSPPCLVIQLQESLKCKFFSSADELSSLRTTTTTQSNLVTSRWTSNTPPATFSPSTIHFFDLVPDLKKKKLFF